MDEKNQMSAADVAHAICGILECSRSVKKIFDLTGKKDKEDQCEMSPQEI